MKWNFFFFFFFFPAPPFGSFPHLPPPLNPSLPFLPVLSPLFSFTPITPPPIHPSIHVPLSSALQRWSIRKPSWPSDLWRSMRSVLRSSISPSRSWKPGSASWSPVAMAPFPRQPFSVTNNCCFDLGQRGMGGDCVSVRWYLLWARVCAPRDTALTTQFSPVTQPSILCSVIGGI